MRILNTYTEYVPPDNPRTAEEIRDLCCTDVPFDPCAKFGRVSDYQGAEKEDWNFDPDQLLEQARADNPGKRILSVRVEGIGNRPGKPCGKKYESWTGKNNCCDFVEPMEWDWENSAEVVAPGSRVVVGFIGGAPPFYVEVRGEGFTLDGYNRRNGWVDTNYFWVYASSISCGWCPITVSDGCSVVSGGVRSTLGQWLVIAYQDPNFPCSCGPDDDWDSSPVWGNWWQHTCTKGQYKQDQGSNWQRCEEYGPMKWCIPDGPWCLGNPCGVGDSCIWWDTHYRWVC